MSKTAKMLTLLAITSISSISSAAPNIDVMIVFSDDSGLSTFDKTLVAARYQVALTEVYDFQLDGSETVEVWPLIIPEMSFTAANKTNAEAMQWMQSENANLFSALRIGRESLGNPGADLVLMVVPGTTSGGCGAASSDIPLVVSTSRSETHAFGLVVLEESDPNCLEELVIPHEIGHLLYAEHQFDLNGDDLLPSYKNHATQSSSSSLKSLMWHPLVASSTDLLSGFLPNMTSGYADNVDFMSSSSFNVVSLYRAPPPGPPTVVYIFLGCHQPHCALWDFDYSSSGATQYRIESQDYFGGPWSLRTVTSSTSYYPHLGAFGKYWRIRGENSGGSGIWIVFYVAGQCNEDPIGGGGGGGPIP